MTDGRWWVALVTFERVDDSLDVLPEWALGACGWMLATAPDEEGARDLFIRDVEHRRLRVIQIADDQEVFGDDEIAKIDQHLADNFRDMQPGYQTVWGTIHCYKGEGEA